MVEISRLKMISLFNWFIFFNNSVNRVKIFINVFAGAFTTSYQQLQLKASVKNSPAPLSAIESVKTSYMFLEFLRTLKCTVYVDR